MRWLVLIGLASCGFSVRESPTDATVADEAVIADTSIDGSPLVDTDGDGQVDSMDNCPAIPNAAQHDFDADGRGDECDRCPHIASGTDPDADGDGVGDACDPRPAIAGDTRILWRGFYDTAELTGWRHSNGQGQWAVTGSKLVQSDPAPALTLLDSPQNYGDLYFASRIEVVTPLASGSAEIGVCSGDIPQGFQYYCCALDGVNGKTVRATSAWNGSNGQLQTLFTWIGTAAAGDTIDVTGTMTATNSVCTFRQGTTFASVSTTRGPVTPGSAVFYTQITQAKYHYLFAVAIGP